MKTLRRDDVTCLIIIVVDLRHTTYAPNCLQMLR